MQNILNHYNWLSLRSQLLKDQENTKIELIWLVSPDGSTNTARPIIQKIQNWVKAMCRLVARNVPLSGSSSETYKRVKIPCAAWRL